MKGSTVTHYISESKPIEVHEMKPVIVDPKAGVSFPSLRQHLAVLADDICGNDVGDIEVHARIHYGNLVTRLQSTVSGNTPDWGLLDTIGYVVAYERQSRRLTVELSENAVLSVSC